MISTTSPVPEVELQVIKLVTPEQNYQALAIGLLKPKDLITTQALPAIEIPQELNEQRGVILYGRAPNWLYNHLGWRLRQLPWLAYYDLRSQSAIVVNSNRPERQPGDLLPIVLSNSPGPAILIGGPPNSGKSVLSHALRRSLVAARPDLNIYRYPANWDGEGNHTYETPNADLANRLRQENNRKLHKHLPDESLEKYFQERAEETARIRNVLDLTLVDVGGIPDPRKAPIVEECSHYIVISKDRDEVQAWHDLCQPPLKPLAIVHSVLEERCEILQTEPFIEIIAGPWLRDRPCQAPDILIQEILKVVG